MITIDEKLCKGCNICIELCPRQVYEESKTIDSKGVLIPIPKYLEECRKCELCTLLCPDQAISVDEEDES
ncbi:MAG: 4Fe-4S dicluster domain-containing protein [Euryarchaeota archaeon]|nr:4Fe-4S dicluster domain-containing protein [Euryarchaeota archaeon]